MALAVTKSRAAIAAMAEPVRGQLGGGWGCLDPVPMLQATRRIVFIEMFSTGR